MMIHNLIALEIIEQTSETIVARDFLNMKRISVTQLIRRMDIITRAMIVDSKISAKEDIYDSLVQRDKDVNRLAILTLRTIKFMNSTQHSWEDLYRYYVTYDHLERIADDAKRIARYLSKKGYKATELAKINDIYDAIEKIFGDAMKAYYLRDAALAQKTSKFIRENVLQHCNDLEENTKNKNCAILVEKFRTLCNHIKNIDRINY